MELNREMTNEEAIEWLVAIEEKYIHGGDEGFDNQRRTALHLARNALALIKQLTEEKKHLEYTLLGVMHSVDKWLDGAELEQDEVNRAATMREKTLQIVEKLTAENEKLTINMNVYGLTAKRLAEENEDLKAIAEQYQKQFEEAKADTVREMQERIKTRCIKSGIYPAIVARAIDQVAKEMLEGDR